MDELRQAAESMKRTYSANDPEQASDEAHTIHNPGGKGTKRSMRASHPAAAETQVSRAEQKPSPLKPTSFRSRRKPLRSHDRRREENRCACCRIFPRRVGINRKHGCRRYLNRLSPADRVA